MRSEASDCSGTIWFVLLPDRRKIAPILVLPLEIDLPGAAIEVEVVDKDTAQCRIERVENIGNADTQCLRLVAVDIEEYRWVGRGEGREDAGQVVVLVRGADESLHNAAELRRRLPLQGLKLIFEAAAGRKANDRRQIEGDHGGGADLLHDPESLADHRLCGILRGLAILEGLELDDQKGVVRLAAAVKQRIADDRKCLAHLRKPEHQLFNLCDDLAGPSDRSAVGQLHCHEKGSLILLREEARRSPQGEAEDSCRKDQNDDNAGCRKSDEPAHDTGVTVARLVD